MVIVTIFTLASIVTAVFDILVRTMPSDASAPQPSARERRAYYRITVTLPIRIQPETDTTEGALIEKSVNISGGGIGVTVTVAYQPGEVLSVALLLPDHGIFKSYIEVLRLDPLPYPGGTYRLHARFVRMPAQDLELLIRYITRFQRDHLQEHYSV